MRGDKSVLGLVKSILTLSENMDIDIIAEGVEELEDAKLLSDLKCDSAQGFYFSRPLADEALLDLLNKTNAPNM